MHGTVGLSPTSMLTLASLLLSALSHLACGDTTCDVFDEVSALQVSSGLTLATSSSVRSSSAQLPLQDGLSEGDAFARAAKTEQEALSLAEQALQVAAQAQSTQRVAKAKKMYAALGVQASGAHSTGERQSMGLQETEQHPAMVDRAAPVTSADVSEAQRSQLQVALGVEKLQNAARTEKIRQMPVELYQQFSSGDPLLTRAGEKREAEDVTREVSETPLVDKRIVLGLELCPLLGCIGITRFYLRSWISGMVQMLVFACSCGVLGTIWGFVDMIILVINALTDQTAIDTFFMTARFENQTEDTANLIGMIVPLVWLIYQCLCCFGCYRFYSHIGRNRGDNSVEQAPEQRVSRIERHIKKEQQEAAKMASLQTRVAEVPDSPPASTDKKFCPSWTCGR